MTTNGEPSGSQTRAERRISSASGRQRDAQIHRFAINFTAEFFDELRDYAEDRGITITELVRQALTYERFLYEHRDWEFLMVQETPEGRRERQLVLPLMEHHPIRNEP